MCFMSNLFHPFAFRGNKHNDIFLIYSTTSASSHPSPNPWKLLWALGVPPRIKSFGWKMCVGALATCDNIAKCIKHFNMSFQVCGALEDSATHALLECPLTTAIWEASRFPPKLWNKRYSSIMDSLLLVHESRGQDDAADFLAILWEAWNSRNRFIFATPDRS